MFPHPPPRSRPPPHFSKIPPPAVEVSASRVRASDIEGPQSIENYNAADIDASGAFTLDDFFDTLPPGAEGDEQLALIDGQPACLAPALLALGMIEGIEVSVEGSMPRHGARARGPVINIRLKKDYSGREIGGRTTHSFAGGGTRHRLDLRTHGDAFTTPGGPVRLSFQARASAQNSMRRTTSSASDPDEPAVEIHRRGFSLSGSTSIPFIERQRARPGLRRLELELSGDYEHEDSGASEREFEAGFVWSPARSLSLRFRHAADTENNAILRDLRSDSLTGETFIDPRRDSSSVSGVEILVRDLAVTAPEQSRRTQFGLTYEPAFLAGFRFSANYADLRRDPLFEDEFDPQDVINNEATFPGRVIRDTATPEDLALDWPGRIVAVDTTGGDAGAALSRDFNVSVDYRLPEQPYGRLHFKLDARHVLESRYELRPGLPFINDGGNRFNPPDWRVGGHLSWSHEGWTASLRGNHTGSVTTAIIDDDLPAYTEFAFNLGYRWQEPLWGDFGRGTRLMAHIENLFDRDPPFADTLNGYRGGSPLGRTLSLSLEVPL